MRGLLSPSVGVCQGCSPSRGCTVCVDTTRGAGCFTSVLHCFAFASIFGSSGNIFVDKEGERVLSIGAPRDWHGVEAGLALVSKLCSLCRACFVSSCRLEGGTSGGVHPSHGEDKPFHQKHRITSERLSDPWRFVWLRGERCLSTRATMTSPGRLAAQDSFLQNTHGLQAIVRLKPAKSGSRQGGKDLRSRDACPGGKVSVAGFGRPERAALDML